MIHVGPLNLHTHTNTHSVADIFKAIQVIEIHTNTFYMALYIVRGRSLSVNSKLNTGAAAASTDSTDTGRSMAANTPLSYFCPATSVPNWPSLAPPPHQKYSYN